LPVRNAIRSINAVDLRRIRRVVPVIAVFERFRKIVDVVVFVGSEVLEARARWQRPAQHGQAIFKVGTAIERVEGIRLTAGIPGSLDVLVGCNIEENEVCVE